MMMRSAQNRLDRRVDDLFQGLTAGVKFSLIDFVQFQLNDRFHAGPGNDRRNADIQVFLTIFLILITRYGQNDMFIIENSPDQPI